MNKSPCAFDCIGWDREHTSQYFNTEAVGVFNGSPSNCLVVAMIFILLSLPWILGLLIVIPYNSVAID